MRCVNSAFQRLPRQVETRRTVRCKYSSWLLRVSVNKRKSLYGRFPLSHRNIRNKHRTLTNREADVSDATGVYVGGGPQRVHPGRPSSTCPRNLSSSLLAFPICHCPFDLPSDPFQLVVSSEPFNLLSPALLEREIKYAFVFQTMFSCWCWYLLSRQPRISKNVAGYIAYSRLCEGMTST